MAAVPTAAVFGPVALAAQPHPPTGTAAVVEAAMVAAAEEAAGDRGGFVARLLLAPQGQELEGHLCATMFASI